MENQTIELLCRLPHAANLQQICDLSYQILGNPVFISDLAHTILAYTKCVEIADPTWQEHIVESKLERETLGQEREVGAVHDSSAAERRPVLVEDDYLPYPRIIKSLTHKGQAVGVMVVTAYVAPFRAGDIDMVELISSFIVPRLTEDRFFISDTRQTVENFFIKLLDGAKQSRDRVQKRLDILGYRSWPHTYVLAVCAGHAQDSGPQTGIGELLQRFRQMGCCRSFMYNTMLVCVYGSGEDVHDWEAQAPELFGILRQENLLAGVSRELHDPGQLRQFYLQATTALEIGLRLGRPDRFYRYDDLSSFALFGSIPRDELELYCHQKVQELGAYDNAHGTELCITLQVYLEQAKSLARTAEILFIHRNTVRYRIKKCMELINSDLEDGNEIFAYILSLRILEFHRKFPPGADERPI